MWRHPKRESLDVELLVLNQLAEQIYAESRQRRDHGAKLRQGVSTLRSEMAAQRGQISELRKSLAVMFRELQRLHIG